MSNIYINKSRSEVAQLVLKLIPLLVSECLHDDQVFLSEYGLKSDSIIDFYDSTLSLQRSKFFEAIRKVYSGNSEVNVIDSNGKAWILKSKEKDGESSQLIIFSGDRQFILPGFYALSPDPSFRLRAFEREARGANLPEDAQLYWSVILSDRSLSDDEVFHLHSDFKDTPDYVGRFISHEIMNRRCSISSLVGFSRRYFERLVGKYNGSKSIQEYAETAGKDLMSQLISMRSDEGLSLSLLLSSHETMVEHVDLGQLKNDDIIKVFKIMIKDGDCLSQLGAIEIGLRFFHGEPEVEDLIVDLVKRILHDDITSVSSSLKFFSSLFVLVDGEISSSKLMPGVPPFYRRLASLAHAAFIQRQFVKFNVPETIFDWWQTVRAEEFYVQSMVDMRIEPRWTPDFATVYQMKQEFLGRIMNAGTRFNDENKSSKINELILGAAPDSVRSYSENFRPYYPGPLEGTEECSNILPSELSDLIDRQINRDRVDSSSFIALVNSAMLFSIDVNYAELAAKTLKIGNYQLSNLKDISELLVILNGLAMVAAISRCPALTSELRIIIRRYRHDSHFNLSFEDSFRILLISAASYKNQEEWLRFVGESLTELAFEDLDPDVANSFFSHLQCLLCSEPQLWLTCAKVDAALKAYIESRPPCC